MAERERGYLAATRIQVGIGSDAQSVGLLLDGCDNGAFDLAFSPGFENDHLQSEAAHRGTEQRDELAAPHYSMTSSARSSVAVGITKPSAFAALRLTTSRNRVGACTG